MVTLEILTQHFMLAILKHEEQGLSKVGCKALTITDGFA